MKVTLYIWPFVNRPGIQHSKFYEDVEGFNVRCLRLSLRYIALEFMVRR